MSQQDLSMVAAFRAAKKYLAPSGIYTHSKSVFICCALARACRAGSITKNQKYVARKVITTRMQGCYSLERWLEVNHPELSAVIEEDLRHSNGRKLQKTRKAWLNSLIKEFS